MMKMIKSTVGALVILGTLQSVLGSSPPRSAMCRMLAGNQHRRLGAEWKNEYKRGDILVFSPIDGTSRTVRRFKRHDGKAGDRFRVLKDTGKNKIRVEPCDESSKSPLDRCSILVGERGMIHFTKEKTAAKPRAQRLEVKVGEIVMVPKDSLVHVECLVTPDQWTRGEVIGDAGKGFAKVQKMDDNGNLYGNWSAYDQDSGRIKSLVEFSAVFSPPPASPKQPEGEPVRARSKPFSGVEIDAFSGEPVTCRARSRAFSGVRRKTSATKECDACESGVVTDTCPLGTVRRSKCKQCTS